MLTRTAAAERAGNHRSFVLMLAAAAATAWLYVAAVAQYAATVCATATTLPALVGLLPLCAAHAAPLASAMSCVGAAALGLGTTLLLLYQCRNIAWGLTTNEALNRRRYEHLQPPSGGAAGRHPFDEGALQNCLRFATGRFQSDGELARLVAASQRDSGR